MNEENTFQYNLFAEYFYTLCSLYDWPDPIILSNVLNNGKLRLHTGVGTLEASLIVDVKDDPFETASRIWEQYKSIILNDYFKKDFV